jgi:hypothetical protein
VLLTASLPSFSTHSFFRPRRKMKQAVQMPSLPPLQQHYALEASLKQLVRGTLPAASLQQTPVNLQYTAAAAAAAAGMGGSGAVAGAGGDVKLGGREKPGLTVQGLVSTQQLLLSQHPYQTKSANCEAGGLGRSCTAGGVWDMAWYWWTHRAKKWQVQLQGLKAGGKGHQGDCRY